MTLVSPRLSSEPTPERRRSLVKAARDYEIAETNRQAEVVAALSEGVAIREVAALVNISTNTVQRWKSGVGA
jgi:DNA-binding NarL/FixJ family response regulator